MSDVLERLLVPRERAAGPQRERDPAEGPIERGVPEVTRPRPRLALPALMLGATLLTGGLVYAAGGAGEAAPTPDGPEAASLPTPPTIPVTAAAPEEAPSAEAAPTPPVAPDRGHARFGSPEVRDTGQSAAAERRAAAEARAVERRRSPLIVGDARAEAGGPPADPVRLGGRDGAYLASLGDGEVPAAPARRLTNLSALVAQGTLVPGVLETAINSDLAGMLRAVVAADVSGFDGTRVLIPRGSRLIGQYRSAQAIGQTRAFVVWTRLITPAGVSVALGSPGTDALGRAGVTGEVDRHFLERFGAALLLSVIGSGAQAAVSGGGDDITINAAGDASRAAEAALASSADIPPTIKVRQGTPIRIFVARDLDFSGVGSSAP